MLRGSSERVAVAASQRCGLQRGAGRWRGAEAAGSGRVSAAQAISERTEPWETFKGVGEEKRTSRNVDMSPLSVAASSLLRASVPCIVPLCSQPRLAPQTPCT